MGAWSGWKTKAELIDHLVRASGSVVTVLDHSLVGRNLWTLCRLDQPWAGKPAGLVFIHLDQLLPPAEGSDIKAWGYTGIDEWNDPGQYDCPLKLLSRSEDGSAEAVRWREQCRAWRRNRGCKRPVEPPAAPCDAPQAGLFVH